MRGLLPFLTVLLLAAACPAQAGETSMMTDLASDHVDITTGFNGSRLVLYGVKDQPGEIAVVVLGPERRMVVRRKSQVLGMWMNRESVDFRNVPVYYNFALSTAEVAIAPPELRHDSEIGLDALDFEPDSDADSQTIAGFKEALVRTRQVQGLLPLEPGKIVFLNDHFFKTSFDLPPNVPPGEYTIKTFLIQNGQVLGKDQTTLKVAQVGFSANIYNFAHDSGLAYGLVGILMALMAGWGANTFLRRD